jgi:O-antigen/teichoic acid export membrane protein
VRLSLWILLTLGIPIALTVFFGADDLVYIFYGPKWGESAFYLKFLVIYAIVGPIVDLGFWLSAALGHTRITMLITAIQSITLVVFATPLTLAFGIVGTLTGAGITSIAALSVSCYYIFRQVPLNIGEILGVPALATGAAAGVLIILLNFTTILTTLPPLIRLISIGIIGPGVFMIILFALRPAEMIERVRYMWQAWNKV